MSPEQLRGGERITAASDVYSMAIIAYEMLTGRRPFNPSSAPQLLEMHREGVRLNPIDLRPTLTTEARAVLLRALSFDPAARYQSAAEFSDSLARALTVTADRTGLPLARPKNGEAIQRENALPALPGAIPPTVVAQPAWRSRNLALGAVLIVLIGIGVGLYIRKTPTTAVDTENRNPVTEPTPTPIPSRSFNYWLNVQKMRNGKPYEQEFLSSGKEIFETGYRFRLNVSSSEPGYVYLFNEGPPSGSRSSFTILYPTPLTNGGLATLGANQVVQTNWNRFAGQTGRENFWIVWSTSVVPELEAAKAEAFKQPRGMLIGDNLVATKKFLMAKEKEVKTKYSTSKETHQTTVRGAGDLLVKMVEFEHR